MISNCIVIRFDKQDKKYCVNGPVMLVPVQDKDVPVINRRVDLIAVDFPEDDHK